MHTQGTAVLDRPAEATAPAQALLSALDLGACVPGLEPAKCTDDAAKALAPRNGDVRDLEYVELAVALGASGVRPQRFRSAGPAQLMEWAAQGLALLGIDRVRHYARRTCDLNLRLINHCMSDHDRAEFAQMWPSAKGEDHCHGAAYRLVSPHPALSRGGF